jgi:hypothetical protein
LWFVCFQTIDFPLSFEWNPEFLHFFGDDQELWEDTREISIPRIHRKSRNSQLPKFVNHVPKICLLKKGNGKFNGKDIEKGKVPLKIHIRNPA